MTIDPTLRGQSNQDDILESITSRLQSAITDYSRQNCFASDQPFPLTHPGGDEICTVSLGGGSFDDQMFAGGGVDTLVDHGTIIVCPIIRAQSRRPKLIAKRLYDGTRTLLARKREILRVLLSADDWEPQDSDTGQPYLRDMLSPRNYTGPQEVTIGEQSYLAMQISFNTVFDWSL